MAFSSFNAYGTSKKEADKAHKPIWLGMVAPHTVGGVLPSAFIKKGALYEAGTPVNLNEGVITPLIMFKVVSLTAGDPNDTVVIYPYKAGDVEIVPAANDLVQKLGSTFAATAKAAKIIAVTALTGDDAGKYSFTVAHSATLDSLSEGDILVFSASTTAGSSKSMKAQPNGYLYNDIYLGDLEVASAKATGAVVDFHGAGLLIDFTPASDVKEQMKAAVPTVIQHRFPDEAFVTIS